MATNPRIKSIERTTGRTWDEWLAFMERIGAHDLNHHQIATKVFEELDGKIENPGWWGQSVTVAYEQESGKRLPGQRPDGTFQISVSKATRLGMEELMEHWRAFAAADGEVLGVIAREPKVSGTEKRITWRTKARDGWDIRVTSEPKKDGTASILADLMGLASHERNQEAKAQWASIFERFLDGL